MNEQKDFPKDAKNGDIVVATIQFMHYNGNWIGVQNLRVSGILQHIEPIIIPGGK